MVNEERKTVLVEKPMAVARRGNLFGADILEVPCGTMLDEDYSLGSKMVVLTTAASAE